MLDPIRKITYILKMCRKEASKRQYSKNKKLIDDFTIYLYAMRYDRFKETQRFYQQFLNEI